MFKIITITTPNRNTIISTLILYIYIVGDLKKSAPLMKPTASTTVKLSPTGIDADTHPNESPGPPLAEKLEILRRLSESSVSFEIKQSGKSWKIFGGLAGP